MYPTIKLASPGGGIVHSLYHADCRDIVPMIGLADAVVTDPPYGLGFMGKGWDRGTPGADFWQAIVGAMKPGAHLLAFGGTRTSHRLVCAIEDAGFEIRDTIAWVYGSGLPKSHDVSKAIDKAAGAERKVVAVRRKAQSYGHEANTVYGGDVDRGGVQCATDPATDAARQWDGWGTGLKPAMEPICVARKPLEGTVAANVLEYGTGAINVDGCRVPGKLEGDPNRFSKTDGGWAVAAFSVTPPLVRTEGRWPANLIHDGSEEVLGLFPQTQATKLKEGPKIPNYKNKVYGTGMGGGGRRTLDDPGGSAARFFYCAKASRADRGEGNKHPTVKPTTLMRYLCRLVTPPGGTILDPFMGSGSTGKAAILEGFRFIGIELDEDTMWMAYRRMKGATHA